jgi:hypothetical protein
VDIGVGDGGKLTPERIERLAVEAPRTRFELARILEMRCTDRGDVDLQVRVPPCDHAGGAGVIEVNV